MLVKTGEKPEAMLARQRILVGTVVAIFNTPRFAAIVFRVFFIHFHFKTPVHQFMCGAHSRHPTTQYNYFWHKYGFINIPAFLAPSRSRKRIHVSGMQTKAAL
jgi:hypothetical protein